jgi:hypothetical protein
MTKRARGNDLHDFELQLHWETDKALLVSDTGIKEQAVWLPKSKIEFEMIGATVGGADKGNAGGRVQVQCPEWLAIEKGLL